MSFVGSTQSWYVVAVVFAALAAYFFARSKSAASRTASDGSCACYTNTSFSESAACQQSAPVGCTLTQVDFEARIARFRDLAARSLRTAHREPFSLHLIYAPEAAQEVRDLVRQEQGCCPFLHFDVWENERGVSVTITATREAQNSADTLFAHFASGSAAVPAPVFAKPKEPTQS